ncbi:hypothetical protein AAFF_G00129560 [Aldrovandia affinis]|uniref:Cadherin domain-containing protein n=1 Tax=Aldrovandia affinis TaxID=143900 RepID=A0AAD7WXF9_9TELE|nr:hypothetical protein AAFF_G00129560 [Aldrovandia affinis]
MAWLNMGSCTGVHTSLLCLLSLLLPLSEVSCQGPQELGVAPRFLFTHPLYNATVYENSAARTYINSEVRMGISLVLCSWEIQTKGGNSAILNREIQDSYALTVKATTKGGLEASTKVNVQVLDMNDLPPLFSPIAYSITISESTPLGTSVAQVTATDADIGCNGEFYYYFREKVENFAIHPTSGMIYLSAKLNADKKKSYDLEVFAVDRGMKPYGNNDVSSTAKISVYVERVNEYAPTMNIDVNIPSLLDKNPVYAVVTVEDLDNGLNGDIEWVSIVAGDPLEQFVVDRSAVGNEYKIKTSEPVDWDSFPYGRNLTLQAKDRGLPPKFSDFQLDREYTSTFSLRIEARDKAKKGSQRFSVTLLTVSLEDVNDCTPTFIPNIYNTRIPEDLPMGTIITWLESQDPDLGPGGQVRYNLLNSFNGMFEVHRNSGAIRLAKELDYEDQQFYNLTVQASDNGQPISLHSNSFVEVEVVDVNENLYAPYFSDIALKASVKENSRIGTSVFKVTAKDNDKGKDGDIRYSIRGVIYTTDTLDHETKDSYWLTICAADRGVVPLYGTIEIYIQVGDVNDNAPLTSDPIYHPTVMENSPKDVSVIRIQAQDLDASVSGDRLSYRITSGNPQNFFAMNPKTGKPSQMLASLWVILYLTSRQWLGQFGFEMG